MPTRNALSVDGSRFDEVTRSLVSSGSRRRLLGGFVGGILGAMGAGRVSAETCRDDERMCREHVNCCSGHCAPKDERGRRLCVSSRDFYVSAFAGRDRIGLPTGIVLRSSQPVTITAVDAGATCGGLYGSCKAGPNGNYPTTDRNALAPNLVVYSQIARVGSGPWVFVGEGPTVVSGTGQLFLAYNDGAYSDNAGGFVATVTFQ
jgi:hypothetical protein